MKSSASEPGLKFIADVVKIRIQNHFPVESEVKYDCQGNLLKQQINNLFS